MKQILEAKLRASLVVLSACAIGMLLASNVRAAGIIYTETDLVSNLPGAVTTDVDLLNAWGIAFLPGSPFWVNANGSGTSRLYDGNGTPVAGLPFVTIPPPTTNPDSAAAAPTGIVANPKNAAQGTGTDFDGDAFIFASEDGIISGWNPTENFTEASIRVDNSSADNPTDPTKNANYKGLAIANSSKGNVQIYATNFRQGTVEVYDKSYNPVTPAPSFKDASLPKGYAPFNIALINGKLFVTYALRDDEGDDDVRGPGHGYIDVFTTDGAFVRRFATGGVLNSPWGLALAPKSFGQFGGKVLVGNFGDGHIYAYNPTLGGAVLGQLWTHKGKTIVPLVIGDLWALTNGAGALNAAKNAIYFSAGPQHESDGLFGTITP